MKSFVCCVLLLAAATACEKREPCSGQSLETVSLPASFVVSADGNAVGTLMIAADHTTTLVPAAGASEGAVAKLEGVLAANSDSASYRYHERDGDTRFSCGASFKKGTAEYPAALKFALMDVMYRVASTPQ